MTGIRGSVLAIDHGEKRTGFAIADERRIVAQPLDVWHGSGDSDDLLEHIDTLLADRRVGAFVVGYPLNMDGSEGPRARAVGAFVERLRRRFPGVVVVKRDERLTTKEAEQLLREAGHHGADRRSRRDSWSALVILRDWLEAGEPR